MKALTTALTAAIAVAAAATGVITLTAVAPDVQPAVLSLPLPRDPAPDVPSVPQDPPADVPSIGALNTVLYSLADPAIPFADKSGLIEGGIGPVEAHAADKRLQKAAKNGQLPLTFDVANIAAAGPGAATADITASGPQLAPQTMNLTFVDQGGWKLARSSAMALLQATAAH